MDDNFAEHPKIGRLSDAAFRGHVTAILYASRLLTDGFVPDSAMRGVPKKATTELVTAGLWERAEEGWWLHDYLDYNPSRERVLSKRASDSERKRGTTPERNPSGIHEESKRTSHPIPSQTAPTAYANGNPQQPTHDQLYLLKRLFEQDPNWSSVTPGAVAKLNGEFGTATVHQALQDLRESPPAHVEASAYGLLKRICEAKASA